MKPAHEIIKDLRIKNGMSQKALAEQVGMTQQSIALIERGLRKVEFDLFVRIAEILKEPLIDIFVNYGITDKDIYDEIGRAVINKLDTSFENILDAHGATLFIDDNDNYAIKFNNKVVSLTDDEYWAFRNEIEHFIEYSLKRLADSETGNHPAQSDK